MDINFEKGVSFQIEGEIGRYMTLPIDCLIKMAENLQSLLYKIAISDISNDSAIDLNAFKIELSGFRKGSVIPEFKFTSRIQNVITNDIHHQREVINERFENLIELSSTANFKRIFDLYPDAQRRNTIIESLYDFSNSFGLSPVKIVAISEADEILPLYPLQRMSMETKQNLITKIIEPVEEPVEEIVYARQRMTTQKGKVKYRTLEHYSPKKAFSMAYAPDKISLENKTYFLSFPLRCNIEHEKNNFIITSEMLNITGSGQTEEEAQNDFNQEFDFIYVRFNELQDEDLSVTNLNTKRIINILVKDLVSVQQ